MDKGRICFVELLYKNSICKQPYLLQTNLSDKHLAVVVKVHFFIVSTGMRQSHSQSILTSISLTRSRTLIDMDLGTMHIRVSIF